MLGSSVLWTMTRARARAVDAAMLRILHVSLTIANMQWKAEFMTSVQNSGRLGKIQDIRKNNVIFRTRQIFITFEAS